MLFNALLPRRSCSHRMDVTIKSAVVAACAKYAEGDGGLEGDDAHWGDGSAFIPGFVVVGLCTDDNPKCVRAE